MMDPESYNWAMEEAYGRGATLPAQYEEEDTDCIECGVHVWKMWLDLETPDGFIHRICAEACQNELEEAA